MAALVIKSWRAETRAFDADGNFVAIVGRHGGLLSWFLSLLGVDPTTTMKVGLNRIEFSSSSLAGTDFRLIPLEGVCSTYYGYHKPWKNALGIIFFAGFLGQFAAGAAARDGSAADGFGTFITFIGIGSLIALLYYFLNRTLTLGFVEMSGVVNGIRFKRSMIENVDINHEQARRVCDLIQKLIEAKSRRVVATVPGVK